MKRFATFASGLTAFVVAATALVPLGSVFAAGPNLVANPGFETATASVPASWSKDNWGTNTAAYTYETTGHTGSRSATVKVSSYKTGDAKWYFTPVTVKPNTKYTFSNWYKSTVITGIDAVVTTTTNTTNYIHIADPVASADWKQQSYGFTAPANAKQVTFYHYVDKNGTLTVDDYSLTEDGGITPPPANTPPTVTVTSPANNANLDGTVNVTANASDDKAVAGVQFKLDGANLGAADTTAPYSVSWDTKTATKGLHQLTAVATDSENASTTSAAISVNVDNTVVTPTPPTANITSPVANATVSGKTVAVTAEASDAQGIASVQFQVDGQNFGAPDTTAPYAITWDSTTVANGQHYFSAVAKSNAGLTAGSPNVTVTVNNQAAPTPPVVSVTAPAANATVSGKTVAISANASGAQSISNVQFKLDGNAIGAADTTSPYGITWDSTTVANGTHSLTAVATDAANLSTTSSPVSINVQNTVTPPVSGNLIANPSVETASNNIPTSWTNDSWGTNTHNFTYEATGQDGTHSVKTNVTQYTSGDAKWYFTPVTVTPGTTYNYSEWYKSNVASEVDAMVTLNDGTIQYFWLGSPTASASNWTKLNYSFTAPANAKNITIFHVVAKVGYVQNDNFYFGTDQPGGGGSTFTRGLVSLNFDDGWRNIYTNGLPLMQKYGLTSTQYLNSQPVVDGYPDYMTYQMVKDFKAAGHELSWHTRTHADITTLSASQLDTELTIPAVFLTGTGTTVGDYKNFASPYGAYNPTSVAAVMQKYRSHRSTDVGYNGKSNFDITNIKVQNIESTTTPADVQNWVNQAIANKTWLVIVYHEVSTTPEDAQYSVTPANLDAELNIVKQSGVTVKTMDKALDEVTAQL